MGLSAALAARCFRAHFYEIFKAAHIILAAVALAALYEYEKRIVHCSPNRVVIRIFH